MSVLISGSYDWPDPESERSMMRVDMMGEMAWTQGGGLGPRERAWTRPMTVTPSVPGEIAILPGIMPDPSFVNNSTVSVFAPLWGTATIECHVLNLGDRAVGCHVCHNHSFLCNSY